MFLKVSGSEARMREKEGYLSKLTYLVTHSAFFSSLEDTEGNKSSGHTWSMRKICAELRTYEPSEASITEETQKIAFSLSILQEVKGKEKGLVKNYIWLPAQKSTNNPSGQT